MALSFVEIFRGTPLLIQLFLIFYGLPHIGIRLDPFGYYQNIGDLEINSTVDLEQIAYRWKNVHQGGDVYDSAGHHWVAALQGRVDLLPAAELALNTMLISEGIYLSEKLGREVTADEVRERSVSIDPANCRCPTLLSGS